MPETPTLLSDPLPADATTSPPPPEALDLTFKVNGRAVTPRVEVWTTLLDLLRETLQLTGTKKGCDHGQCGACTVLVDGMRINACLALAASYDGCELTTVEGLAGLAQEGESLHPMQRAFIEHDAFQCGYCTPGQLCSAVGLSNEEPPASRSELRERLSGNLCRCGAYPQIADAVWQVVRPPQGNGASETKETQEATAAAVQP